MLVLFVLLVLSAFPFEFLHLGEIRPMFMLMAVYYWTLVRPALLPPVVVFLLGLGLDLLAAWPLGLNALTLVAVQWVVQRQRKFLLGQSFLVLWAIFFLMALGTGILQWILFSLFNLELVVAKPVLISIILSTLLFPLMALPLAMVHKALAENPSSVP